MKSIIWMHLAGLATAILLVGCGGGDNNSQNLDSDAIEISGAGIKGPLAFADVKIYVLDPSYPDYYDKTSPISIAITNQYAEINGLSVPRKIKPPYILTIDGSNAIDLNTGVAPIINMLVTVITDDMLKNNRPIFATPLTTLVFHMARLSTEAGSYKSNRTKSKAFSTNISNAASIVSNTFAVGKDKNISLFTAPLVINEYTSELADQELAVYHRAAVEAFAAKSYALRLNQDVTPDSVIQKLSLDLHRDGIIDNKDNGTFIGNIDLGILAQDPMEMLIPNTSYRIKDLMTLMSEERVLIGIDMGPIFLIEEIAYPEVATTTNPIVTAEPLVMLSTEKVDFGSQAVGGLSDPWPLTLTNSGTTTLSISGISVSAGYTQANNCNNQVPASGNCAIDIQFAPTVSGTTSGTLTVTADDAVGTHTVTLSGTGIDGTQSGDPPSDAVLHADFNDRTLGLYERRDLEIDFQVGQEGYNDTVHGPDYNSTFIVNDPAGNTGRDKVLEVKHFAGTAGSGARAGGMRFRADFSAADEYYFAFDAFVPSVAVGGYDFWFPLQHKQPAMIYGDLLAASHATGEDPLVDGITGFNSRTQFYGQGVFGRGEGSGSTKPLTALDFLESYFWDTVDPARGDPANTYNHPLGRWITIEQRVKMNTADDSNAYDPGIDLADGVLEVWITDPAIGWYGKKVVERLDIVWRFVNTMTIDGLYMYDHYGGNPDDPRNRPPQDQSKYYDNFIVSPSPITH